MGTAEGTPPAIQDINNAIANAISGDTLWVEGRIFGEDLLLAKDIEIEISGGWSFSSGMAGQQTQVRSLSIERGGISIYNVSLVGETAAFPPLVVTATVTDISTTTAQCGGEVAANGGSAVIDRGVCWSETKNPTVSDAKTVDGNGLGVFSSSMTGLQPNTTYHVRAYATNELGTAYGEDVPFTTGAISRR